jgi:hypothetical protein
MQIRQALMRQVGDFYLITAELARILSEKFTVVVFLIW